MKELNIKLFNLCCIFLLIGCGISENRYPKQIKYTVLNETLNSSKIDYKIILDSINQSIRFEVYVGKLDSIINSITNNDTDKITHSVFKLEFYNNEKPILSSHKNHFNIYLPDTSKSFRYNKHYIIKTDTIDIKRGFNIQTKIPLYAFHSLKSGTQTIKLKLKHEFYSLCFDKKDSLQYSKDNSLLSKKKYRINPKTSFSCDLIFNLDIPKIHETILSNNVIEFERDSIIKSDFSLSKNGYMPDVYWIVSDNYFEPIYISSCMRGVLNYDNKDTVVLHHYNLHDSIHIDVFDHDYFSKDDYLGGKSFCIKDLIYKRNINYQHYFIKNHSLKAYYKGIIN